MFFIRRLFSGASPSRIATMEATKATIIEHLKDPRGVTMFSKSECPFCKRAQGRLDGFLGKYVHPSLKKNVKEEDQPYRVVELDLSMQF